MPTLSEILHSSLLSVYRFAFSYVHVDLNLNSLCQMSLRPTRYMYNSFLSSIWWGKASFNYYFFRSSWLSCYILLLFSNMWSKLLIKVFSVPTYLIDYLPYLGSCHRMINLWTRSRRSICHLATVEFFVLHITSTICFHTGKKGRNKHVYTFLRNINAGTYSTTPKLTWD